MSVGGVEIGALIFVSVVATYVRSSRIRMMIATTAVSLVGIILVWKLNPLNRDGRLVGASLSAAYGVNIPLVRSVMSSNKASFTKRSVTSACILAAYCVGNTIGPQCFQSSETPAYPVIQALKPSWSHSHQTTDVLFFQTGIKTSLAGLAFGIFFFACLWFYYHLENRRRSAVYGPSTQITTGDILQAGLEVKTHCEVETFLESFQYVL